MRPVAKFFALPGADRRLLVEALATLVLVRLGLRMVAIERLRAWARRMRPGSAPVERLAWAVRVASRRLPGTTCLGSALTLQRLLSTGGHPSELHIGVARQADNFAAHAWLTCNGRILVGAEEQAGYTPLVAWRAGGSPGAGGSGPG
ncbi:hypothetical protein BH11PSE3_BH11PSE3_08110 [soil metagenome]